MVIELEGKEQYRQKGEQNPVRTGVGKLFNVPDSNFSQNQNGFFVVFIPREATRSRISVTSIPHGLAVLPWLRSMPDVWISLREFLSREPAAGVLLHVDPGALLEG